MQDYSIQRFTVDANLWPDIMPPGMQAADIQHQFFVPKVTVKLGAKINKKMKEPVVFKGEAMWDKAKAVKAHADNIISPAWDALLTKRGSKEIPSGKTLSDMLDELVSAVWIEEEKLRVANYKKRKDAEKKRAEEKKKATAPLCIRVPNPFPQLISAAGVRGGETSDEDEDGESAHSASGGAAVRITPAEPRGSLLREQMDEDYFPLALLPWLMFGSLAEKPDPTWCTDSASAMSPGQWSISFFLMSPLTFA